MKKHTILSFLCICLAAVQAQEVKYGKVDRALLLQAQHTGEPDAAAAIIYKKKNVFFEYQSNTGWRLNSTTFMRVKIYSETGLDHGNFEIFLYKDDSDIERITRSKGYTYNLENDKIEEIKLKSDGIYEEDVNDYLNKVVITMPAVKKGSVIDVEYTVVSPFVFNVDEFQFQHDIPLDYVEATFRVPEYFIFNKQGKGYFPFTVNNSSEQKTIQIRYKPEALGGMAATRKTETADITYREDIFEMTAKQVPALIDESYVNNIDNYRTAVKFELNAVHMPGESIEYYTKSWEKVAETIYKSSSFGGELSKKNYFKDDLPTVIGASTDPMEKAAKIYSFVQNKMNWNGYQGLYTRQGLSKAYEEETGNVAEINLILTAMLRAAGINANPVLISTRDHGISLFPTREGFNYAIAAIESDQGYVLLDATDKFSTPNTLPDRTLNWFGMLVREDYSVRRIDMTPNKNSNKTYMIMADVNTDGTVFGKMRISQSDHYALNHRQKYFKTDETQYLTKLESKLNGIEISDYKVDNMTDRSKPVIETVSFVAEDQCEQIGNKMYFSPLLFLTATENPFKLETRQYPVDFTYPQSDRYTINLKLPEGYQIESLPESAAMALPNNYGSFRYNVSEIQGNLQVLVSFDINQSVIPATEYPNLKAYYNQIIQKETEKIVLVKM